MLDRWIIKILELTLFFNHQIVFSWLPTIGYFQAGLEEQYTLVRYWSFYAHHVVSRFRDLQLKTREIAVQTFWGIKVWSPMLIRLARKTSIFCISSLIGGQYFMYWKICLCFCIFYRSIAVHHEDILELELIYEFLSVVVPSSLSWLVLELVQRAEFLITEGLFLLIRSVNVDLANSSGYFIVSFSWHILFSATAIILLIVYTVLHFILQ